MLSPKLLAHDLHELCRMIDELSLMSNAEGGSRNTVIYEALSYIHLAFLPNVLKQYLPFLQKESLQTAIIDLLDIISLRYEAEPHEKLE